MIILKVTKSSNHNETGIEVRSKSKADAGSGLLVEMPNIELLCISIQCE